MTTIEEHLASILLQSALDRYRWNQKANRWIDTKTGRFVSNSKVMAALRAYNSAMEDKFVQATRNMLEGNTKLQDWQTKIANFMKEQYTVNLLFGRGGKNAVKPEDWGSMGAQLKIEYARLNNFAQEIKQGVLTPRQILYRIKLYARGAIAWFWHGKTKAYIFAGYDLERRILHPAEHCDDCIRYASQGWVPIGTLPPPGIASACMHNCRCSKQFMKTRPKRGKK